MVVVGLVEDYLSYSRWWFQIFVIFIPTWGNDPNLLIFLRWVGKNHQLVRSMGLDVGPKVYLDVCVLVLQYPDILRAPRAFLYRKSS